MFTMLDYLFTMMESGVLPDQIEVDKECEPRFGRKESMLKAGEPAVLPVVYIPLKTSPWLQANALDQYIEEEIAKILHLNELEVEGAATVSEEKIREMAAKFATYDLRFEIELNLKEDEDHPDLMACEIEWTAFSPDKEDCKVGVVDIQDNELKPVYDHLDEQAHFHELLLKAKELIE